MKNPFGIRRLATGIAVLAAAGLTASGQVVFTGQSQDPQGWKTVWYDHFDGTTLNTNNWNIEQNSDGGGNQELQYYGPEGVSVRDGNLVLTATREARGGKPFTSGRINSKSKVYFTHGKVEARIKMPKTFKGLWPAFWMMGERGVWPANGEIDIVEMGHSDGWNVAGNDPENYLNGAYHWGTDWNHHAQHAMTQNQIKVQDGNYHIFTCEWSREAITMYLDGTQYCSLALNVNDDANAMSVDNYFHKPNHILFNLAVGGMFPGITDPNGITAALPAEMLVDWVRVSQPEGDDDYQFMEQYNPDDETFEPDPTTDTGLWGSKAVDDSGNYTFDVDHAGDMVLISTTYGVTDMLTNKGKVLKNYNVDNTTHHLYIWEETYYATSAAPVNSFGFEEGNSVSLAVSGNLNWSGAGFASSGEGKDLSMIDDSYVLHFAMRGGDKSVHAPHTIVVGNVEFTIGRNSALGDYPRDGEWYNFDIPVKVLRRLNPTLFDNPAAFTGNVFAFKSGSIADTKIQLDNIFFYKTANPIVDVPDTDTRTETGKYASLAIENGQATFDKANSYGYVPLQMAASFYDEVKAAGKVAIDLQSGVGSEFFVWEKTYSEGTVEGNNSLNGTDGYTALTVSDKGWSGAAFNIAEGKSQNLTPVTDPANGYWFHIAFKADDMLFHSTQTITLGNAKFTIGPSDNGSVPSLGDYTRDGRWWNFDIPVKDLLVMAPELWKDLGNFNGDMLVFSSGAAQGSQLNFDNVFFYRNDTKVADDSKDTTPCGQYMSASLSGGASTFDFNNAADIIPVRVSSDVTVSGKLRAGYETLPDKAQFMIWQTDYDTPPVLTMTEGEGSGVNSFGKNESFTSCVVSDRGWSGAAFNVGKDDATDLSVISTEENYYLHLAIRDNDYVTHFPYTIKVNGKGIKLGNADGCVTDFTRDGEWYSLDIPVSAISTSLFTGATNFSGDLFTFDAGGKQGTRLEIDNIFFYKNLNPDQPIKPAVEPKVALRASSTSPFVGNKVTLTATTTVPADVTVTKVEFFEGETSIGTDTEAPYTCEFTPAEAKTYSLKAVMTLSDDRTATSAEVKVTARVDNPTVSLAAAPATVTEGETVTLTANVHVPQGAEATNVEFKVNGSVVSTDTEPPYSYDWTPENHGEYTLTAVLNLADGRTVTSAETKVTVKEKQPEPVDQLQNVPTPVHDADKVYSIFSNRYTNATTFGIGNWGQSTQAELVSINGNDVYKLTDFNYLGWELAGNIDLSGYTHLHVDYYTPDGNTFAFTPVSPGPKEKVLNQTVTAGQWNSYDVKLSDFTGVALNEVFQFKFDQGGNKTGYIANVYAWKEDGSTEDPDPVDPSDGTVFNFTKDEGANLLDGGYIKYIWNSTSSILTVTAHFNEVENGQRTPDNVSFVRPGVTGPVNMISSGKGSYTLEIGGLKGGDTVSGYAFYAIPNAEAQTPLKAFTVPTGGDTPDPVEVTYKGITYTDQVQSHNGYITVPYRVVKISDGVETTLTQEEATELNLCVYYAWNGNDDAQAAIALHSPEGVFYCTGLIPGQDYTFYERFFVNGTQIDGKGNFHASATDTGTDNVYKSLTSGSIKPINKDLTTQDPEDARQLLVNTENFDEGFIYWKRMRTGDVACCNEKQFMNLHMYYWAEQLNDGRLRFTFTYVDVDGTEHTKDADAKGHQHIGLVPAVHFYDELEDGTFQLINPDIDLARFTDEPLRCPATFEPWSYENGKAPVAADADNRAITYTNDPDIETRMTQLGYKTARVETTKAYNETSANIAFNMQFADGGLTLSDVSKLTNIDDNITNSIFNIQNDSEGIRVVDGAIIAPEGSVVFNIHGIPVGGENLAPGIYIVVNGNSACKVLVK